MDEQQREKLLYQYIMNYKAYRRVMIPTRAAVTVAVSGGLFGLCALSVPLGIVIGMIPLFLGAIAILAGLHNERTYMIFDTRFVIKNKDKRVCVGLDAVTAVKYKRAFYEKDLSTGTITVTARTEKGKLKKYKMKHVFDAGEGAEFLRARAAENAVGTNENANAQKQHIQ